MALSKDIGLVRLASPTVLWHFPNTVCCSNSGIYAYAGIVFGNNLNHGVTCMYDLNKINTGDNLIPKRMYAKYGKCCGIAICNIKNESQNLVAFIGNDDTYLKNNIQSVQIWDLDIGSVIHQHKKHEV